MQLLSLEYTEDITEYRLGNYKLGQDKTILSCLVMQLCLHHRHRQNKTALSCSCRRCEHAIIVRTKASCMGWLNLPQLQLLTTAARDCQNAPGKPAKSPKPNFIRRDSPRVASSVGLENSTQEGLRLSGLVHQEAHLCVSYYGSPVFKDV